jgi:hypothetical protein
MLGADMTPPTKPPPKPPVKLPAKHVVKQGEHLSHIAAIYGFTDYRAIWSFGENAELKKKRKDPHVLAPGDIVSIPAPRQKTVTKPTGQVAAFTLATKNVTLAFRILDPYQFEMVNFSCELSRNVTNPDGTINTAGKISDEMVTDDDGKCKAGVEPTMVNAELVVFTQKPLPFPIPKPPILLKYDVVIGGLDPVSTPAGLRGRLNNLGYFAGLTDAPEDREQLFWAIEEFQMDHNIKPQNGNFDDPNNKTIVPTRKKLVEVHGDKEPV